MNTRDYKEFYPGGYYHVYNRGDNRENIFLDEQDYFNFIKRLKIVLGLMLIPDAGHRNALRLSTLPPNTFTILAYCFMPNHFHFLIKQEGSIKISQLITRVCTSYAKYFNSKYKRVGNLFQDTFKAKSVVDDRYLTHLTAYIHNNPVNPLAYPYSSFSEYLTPGEEKICNTEFILSHFKNDWKLYKAFVMESPKDGADILDDLTFDEPSQR